MYDNLTLEERYTKAMEMAGYQRTDIVDSIGIYTLAFKKNNSSKLIQADGWEMIGDELEDIKPILDSDLVFFNQLIHPEGRISFFCKNLGNTESDENINFSDLDTAVHAYLSAETDGRMLGFQIGEIKRVISSFDMEDMQNHFVRSSTNISFYDDLTVNERNYIKNTLQKISSIMEKNNMYFSIRNGIYTITNKCMEDVINGKTEWGAWSGRIANANRPQDYIDVDIAGYTTRHEIICNLNVIHANDIISGKQVNIDVKDDDFENSVREGIKIAVKFFDSYINEAIELLDTEKNVPMHLFFKDTVRELTEHYDILNNAGYEAFPSNRKGLEEMNTDEVKDYIKNFFLKYDPEIICTSRVLDALANSVVKMIESGKIFHIEEEVDKLLTKPSILSFIKQRTPLVVSVSGDVINSVKEYFEENLRDYTPIEVCRASNYPDDHYLYAVIAMHNNGNFACWTSWNQSTKSMNYGHYSLESREAAYFIIKENFNDISGEPEKYGPDKSLIYMETAGDKEVIKNNSTIIQFSNKARGR